MQTITVTLPKLHNKQQAFIGSNAKRRVIVAGRRGGKTTGVSILAVEAMLSGRRVLEAAPIADQTEAFWASCKKYTAPLIRAKVITKNETERRLEMAGNGGRIRCKTAFDADGLRGDYADLLILDEYSLMKPDTWDEVGAPMLLDNDGDAVFIFTPKRKNHAHSLYARALGDDTGRWKAWHFTSFDNPYLSKPALAEITADMTDDAYRQEIMAEFLENEGAVFRNIAACMTAEATTPESTRSSGMNVLATSVPWWLVSTLPLDVPGGVTSRICGAQPLVPNVMVMPVDRIGIAASYGLCHTTKSIGIVVGPRCPPPVGGIGSSKSSSAKTSAVTVSGPSPMRPL